MRLGTPSGQVIVGFLFSLITIILSFGPAAIASPVAQPTPTPTVGQWLDRPPGGSASATCPASGQWLLLYWGGSEGTPIAMAADACANAEFYWVSREGRWQGFAKSVPAASDEWNVLTGEAHFIRGR